MCSPGKRKKKKKNSLFTKTMALKLNCQQNTISSNFKEKTRGISIFYEIH